MARLFRDRHGLTFPIVVDETGQVATALKVEAFPTNIIIDREGNIHDSFAGFDERRLDKALRELDIL